MYACRSARCPGTTKDHPPTCRTRPPGASSAVRPDARRWCPRRRFSRTPCDAVDGTTISLARRTFRRYPERGGCARTTKELRREFTDEFEREAASPRRGSGRPLTRVAAEPGIQPSAPRPWRDLADDTGPGAAAAVVSAERAESRRAREGLDRTGVGGDLPKEAAGTFSGPPSRGSGSSKTAARRSPYGRCARHRASRRRLLRLARPARKRPRRGEPGAGRGRAPRARLAAGRRRAGGAHPHRCTDTGTTPGCTTPGARKNRPRPATARAALRWFHHRPAGGSPRGEGVGPAFTIR